MLEYCVNLTRRFPPFFTDCLCFTISIQRSRVSEHIALCEQGKENQNKTCSKNGKQYSVNGHLRGQQLLEFFFLRGIIHWNNSLDK